MPVAPIFDWEQSLFDVTIRATIKGFKADAIDVFISDLFVKVNASPTYLLLLDLLKPIIVEKSSFRIDGAIVKITLPKATEEIWMSLCVDKRDFQKKQLNKEENDTTETKNDRNNTIESNSDISNEPMTLHRRRKGAIERAEKLYNTKLDTREKQKEIEKKRMFNEQWELEKKQRQEIIDKVQQEKKAEQEQLYEWEEQTKLAQSAAKKIQSPADIAAFIASTSSNSNKVPGIRNSSGDCSAITLIDFTTKSLTAPARSRGDEEYYRRSRYKPVSIEDSPMFWKEKADKLYRARDFRSAAEAYTESIKRDGCFLNCISNRAACYIHLHDYKRAIEDCDLALTLLANTPASETTQERYKSVMCRLHTRRGAARCWDGQYAAGAEDFRMAVAYREHEKDMDVVADLATVEDYMKRAGITSQTDPSAALSSEAAQYYYNGKYDKATDIYRQLLSLNEFDIKSRSNLAAALLQQGAYKDALIETDKVIAFCAEVAHALTVPGAKSSSSFGDSDDEDENEDELVARKNAAAKKIGEKSGHVYLLLKAYVRASAAHCGLKEFQKAFELMEMAVRITPYDDDLREDANKILEKLKFDTLVSASKAK